MKEYQGEKAIISLTSWKARINTVGKTIYSLLKNCPGFHIVLVLSEEEFPQKEKELPEDLMLFVNNNLIELLWFYENIGPHKKYYPTMLKYRDVPIITVDDDGLYSKQSINVLYETYLRNKDSIICNRAHLIKVYKNHCSSYNSWQKCINKSNDSKHIFPTGVGGVLYPPNILDVGNINIEELKQCIFADDIYLKVLENRKSLKIKITDLKNELRHPIELSETKASSLYKLNVNLNRNDVYIKLFEKDLV